MLKKVSLLYLLLLPILVTILYSMQVPITSHKIISGIGTAPGKIFFIKHETKLPIEIYAMNEDGTNVMKITSDNMYKGVGDLFPDKTKFVLVEKDDYNDHISLINADATNPQRIYTTPLSIAQIKVSPDSKKIAFVAYDPQNISSMYEMNSGTLYIIYLDNITTGPGTLSISGPKLVATDVKLFSAPQSTLTVKSVDVSENICFSPDSTSIAFINATGYISVVKIDGTSLVTISSFSSVGNLTWLKPPINRILFIRYEYNIAYGNTVYSLATLSGDGKSYSVIYSTTAWIDCYSVSNDESKVALVISNNINRTRNIVVTTIQGTIMNEISAYTDSSITASISWLSDDTKLIFSDGKNIYSIDPGNPVLTNLTNNTFDPMYSLIDARGNKILFTNGYQFNRTLLFTMNIDGSNKTNILTSDNNISVNNTLLSPDGTKLLYSIADRSSNMQYKLFIKNTDGTGSPVLIEENSQYSYYDIKWSPKGTKILFFSGIDYRPTIVDSNGINPKPILQTNVYGTSFVFSPDDTKILFSGSDGNQNGIFVVDLNTELALNYKLIFSTTESIDIIDWKSNKILLCKYVTETYYNLYLMNSDGSGFKYIDTGDAYYSKLSPDGTKLAYIGIDNKGQRKGLFICNTGTSEVNIGGGNSIKLTLAKESTFDWSPDSKKIVYTDYYRTSELTRIFVTDLEKNDKVNLNPSSQFAYNILLHFIGPDRIIYEFGFDIWLGDLFVTLPPEISIPKENGIIKIVVPEGAGEKGTFNPNRGQPVSIGFKGKEGGGKFTLKVFTQFGEKIYEETKEVTTADGWFEWIPKNLASGIYLVSVEGPGVKIFKKIPILR